MDSPRVAVVIEDDQDIRELIKVVLNQSGFDVHTSNSGAAGVKAVREHHPAVVTLDLGLPDIDGFEVARRIRLFSDSYIIMLTARDDELDTLLGLETGADDYLTKPFRPRELRARVGALMRRPRLGSRAAPASDAGPAASPAASSPHASSPTGDGVRPAADGPTFGSPSGAAVACSVRPEPDPGREPRQGQDAGGQATLVHDGLSLNEATRTVEFEGVELDLTRTEFDLLLAMMESGRLVRSKGDLVRRLRGEEYEVGSYISDADERTIEVHMANLRRKLGDDPRSPRWIKTVRGVGYKLAL
ncbi:response regulator transcription factor [Arthrobacter dokdonensis]|uniref:response regulator transcription factor n=1 Tax=Arthrobacter dokdonellae TaxID=2211210 RepID=UPI000DE58519|nr:response regulator transcription factor [Arthrobacter dokdonellae]